MISGFVGFTIVGDTTVFNYDAEADSYHSIMEYENEED
jgi:hypothetical protein